MTDDFTFLDETEGQMLVEVARLGLERFVRQQEIFQPDLAALSPGLCRPGTSFVTLTNRGLLRGCRGNVEAQYALAEDVARNAAAAARDFRFPPVVAAELDDIRLEVSVLTIPLALAFVDYNDLLGKLSPEMDGVILAYGPKRALLLPQVWRRIPDPALFLDILARKGGIPTQVLRRQPPIIECYTFRTQEFMELGYRDPEG